MVCPKCGWEQPAAAECAKCGVLVARYRTRSAAAAVDRPEAPETAPSGSSPLRSVLAGALSVLILVVIYGRSGPGRSADDQPASTTLAEPAEAPVLVVAETPPPQAAAAGASSDPTPDPTPAPVAETLPSATCPLSDHGFGAPPSRGRISSGWYTRASDYPEAQREQEAAAAPMVVYVYTDWCGYCRVFERDLLSSVAVDSYLRDGAVKVRINPETDSSAGVLARELGAQGFPSFFIATPRGAPEKVSLYRARTQLKSPEEFIEGIEERMKRQAQVLLALGAQQRQSRNARDAVATLTQAVRIVPESPRAYRERAWAFLENGDPEKALDDLARGARLPPGGLEFFRDAESLLARQQRWDEAIACWTSFLDSNASSGTAYLARARILARRGAPGLSGADLQKACALGEAQACRSIPAASMDGQDRTGGSDVRSARVKVRRVAAGEPFR